MNADAKTLDILIIGIPITVARPTGLLDSAVGAIQEYIDSGYHDRRVARDQTDALTMSIPMITWAWSIWHRRNRVTARYIEREVD